MAAFVAALLAGDRGSAGALALEYMAMTRSRLAVVADLLHPAQYRVGELWYQGRVEVADEHRATAIVGEVAAELPPTPVDRPVRPGAQCLLAGLPGEEHVLGLSLLALALADEGWTVEQLPTGTSHAELVRAAAILRPDVVGLSSAYLRDLREITDTVAELRALGMPVVVGGPTFNRAPELWRLTGADAHGSDARVSTVLMRRLLR